MSELVELHNKLLDHMSPRPKNISGHLKNPNIEKG